jgi:hypothetical protein
MALIDKLSDIGVAIREKTGKTDLLTLAQMPSEIRSISGGGAIATTSLWADGSWDEISDVLDRYYAEEIDDLTQYFSVGNKRTIHLSAMDTYSSLTDTHDECDMDIVIIDIEHDVLATPFSDNRTKAAITVQLVDLLKKVGQMETRITTTNSTVGTNATYSVYSNTLRRAWCNDIFYNSLPSEMGNLVKEVTKKTCRGIYSPSGATISSTYISKSSSTEKCFMLSYSEIHGGEYPSYSIKEDEVQYEYYKNNRNLIKWKDDATYPQTYCSRNGVIYRSGNNYTTSYVAETTSGVYPYTASTLIGLCPAWNL